MEHARNGERRDLRETDRLENLGVDGRRTLKWIFENEDGGMCWIGLVQDRDKLRAFTSMHAVMNLRVP